jgi:phage major head subunit gpT-like protein
MALIRENFIELEGSIQKVHDAYYEQKTDYLPLMFNIQKSTRSQENHLGLGGLSMMEEWNGEVSYDDFAKGYEKNYRHIKYSKGMQVQRELIDFEEFAEIKKRAGKLSRAVHKTLQVHGASVFNFAFDSTITGPDGQALCSASHRITPGDEAGVQTNTGTSSLTVDNIETTKRAGRQFKDDRGDIMDVNLNLIICGDYWEKTAKQICGSEKEPYNADNQKNIYKDELTYLVNPYITGKKWFLASAEVMKGGEGLNWYTARDPRKVEYKDDFDTEIGKYKCVGMWSKGWDSFYWVFGHNPA